MSHKSYNAEEIEQKLIRQLQQNPSIAMMNEDEQPPRSGSSHLSSLYMDEVNLGDDYSPTATAPPAVTILNIDGKGYIDDRKSNKHGRCYRNTLGPVLMFAMGVVILSSVIAIAVVSTQKNAGVTHPQFVADEALVEKQQAEPQLPATVPDPSENKGKDDFKVVALGEDEDEYDYEDGDEYDYKDEDVADAGPDEADGYDDEFSDEMVCVPDIKFKHSFLPESIPQVASDGTTVAVMHGKRLNFYGEDRTQSFASVSMPSRRRGAEEIEMTFALDGTTGILGDYTFDYNTGDDTGKVFVLQPSGTDKEHVVAQEIEAPEDVEDGGMFGYSIDIFGDRMIVGAPYGDSDDSGLAFLYERTDEGNWEVAEIFPPDLEDGPPDEFALFGESVAIHKNRAAVSGYNELDEVCVFIYEYNKETGDWEEVDDIIVDKNCRDCKNVGVAVSFRDEDGGLFISYPRKNEVSYLVPTELENGGEYVLVDKIFVDDDDEVDVDMDQVQIGGDIMVVGVTDEFGANLVYLYSQSDDDDKWIKVKELELPENEDFDPDVDYIDLALSRSSLIVNYGDDKLLWYTLDGCDR